MDLTYSALFLKMVAAHMLGDFPFQPDAWAQNKRVPRHWLSHLGVHGLLMAMVVASEPDPGGIWLPAAVLVAGHGLIDLWTGKVASKSIMGLVWDQSLHLLTIALVFVWMRPDEALATWQARGVLFSNPNALIVVSGWLCAVNIGSVVVGAWVRERSAHLPHDAAGAHQGLEAAGRWIGMAERMLIFLAVLLRVEMLAGFVIGAKAILRFPEASEKKSRALAEYYLLGTLLSAGWAVGIGCLTRWLLSASAR